MAAVSADTVWEKELHRNAAAHGPPSSPARPPGKGADKGTGKRPDVRFKADRNRRLLGWAWNHSESGYRDVCSANRVRACEWRRSPEHRIINYSQKPQGWTP